MKRTVKRLQFPITAAYAFTDYCSQGQTITNVLVDIATPLSGKLSLFHLYVALLRTHNPELLEEDDRLNRLDTSTKLQWEKVRER
ncbi:hypothetical protein BDQ17DRAFT_1248903 [Cyathus striatus]|nr:hypothetical protein BDQ17DRAFT_1248903 [Cyathus striatus]